MTRTDGSAAARSTAARKSPIIAVVSAFRLAGRLRVIEQTWSTIAVSISSATKAS